MTSTSIVLALLTALPSARMTVHQVWSVLPKLQVAEFKVGQTPCRGFVVDTKSSLFAKEKSAFQADWPELISKTGRKIEIHLDPNLAPEEYWLTVGPKAANIRAATPIAVAWALETLGQLTHSKVTRARIHDQPQYSFRCVTVDVARRFHSMSTLRQIVKWCKTAKVRFVQLHLTDDQNWMLPTRVLAGVDRNNTSGHPAYSFTEIRDLQAFAAARGIAIIPEIDIPGHSSLLVRFDPGKFTIKGSASTNCVNFGSPEVLRTIAKLVREISRTFSGSPFIHIGGDEAWYPDAEKDPEIAKAMDSHHPKGTPQDVFVDFVAGMAKTVLSERKIPIVWEGFSPTPYAQKTIPRQTVVVAWEGAYYPADQLIRDGFQVVNAGWDPCYVVNHYPYDSFTLVPVPTLLKFNPETFGIVNWQPGSSGSTKLHPKGNLLGSMLCWWEGYEWNAQSTLPLRILAIGSRLWNNSAPLDSKNFSTTSSGLLGRLQKQGYPFSLQFAGLFSRERLQFTDRAEITATPGDPSLTIAMRKDGSTPHLSDICSQIDIRTSSVVTVQAYRGKSPVGETQFLNLKKVSVIANLALGAKVVCSSPEDPLFPASVITDGVSGDVGSFWLGYPIPCSLTIDLGRAQEINRVDVVPFWAAGLPTQYLVDLSEDGKTWQQVVDAGNQQVKPEAAGYVHRFSRRVARYMRVRITGTDQFPPSMARIHQARAFLESGK